MKKHHRNQKEPGIISPVLSHKRVIDYGTLGINLILR
jgi:hypothetical protein